MKLSVIIPAYNEADCIENTVKAISKALASRQILHEILVINDNSTDHTESVLRQLETEIHELRHITNTPPNGFGFAVRKGLDHFNGDMVAIVMADGSELPEDIVTFYQHMINGYDCVFGSRFIKGGRIVNYPKFKLALNRLFNLFIRISFGLKYNDVTNAFKMYRAHVIDGLKPFLSHHFNLTVELPLKAIIRGYSYSVVPNTYINRSTGESKLKIKEMGSRYLFIVIYCFIEKWLSRGDYRIHNS